MRKRQEERIKQKIRGLRKAQPTTVTAPAVTKPRTRRRTTTKAAPTEGATS